jgi:hypothetical protein
MIDHEWRGRELQAQGVSCHALDTDSKLQQLSSAGTYDIRWWQDISGGTAMNSIRVGVIAGLFSVAFITHVPQLAAQSCQDDQAMADAQVKTLADMVDVVKKESQADFEAKFHQKSCLNKLTFAISAVNDAIACFDKAGPVAGQTSPKDGDSKLKDRMTGYKGTLKSTDDPKSAKALIATFDVSTGPPKTAEAAGQ